MKHLVTVTCGRDLRQMVLQSHSIQKFITCPCTHHVFIEDQTLSISELTDILSPYYTKHQLIVYKDDSNPQINLNGWYRQQIIKINAVNHINEDYLILDSKNFFIKPTSLEYEWPEGSCLLLERAEWTDKFMSYLKETYHKETPAYHYTQQTPFKIRKSVALRVLELFNLEKMFIDCAEREIYPSEFVLYAIASDITPTKELWDTYFSNTNYHTFWWSDELNPDKFEDIYNSTVEILGLHKNVWYNKNNNLELLADWLCSKGLDKEYVYPATVNMDWGNTYLQDRSPTF